MPNFSKLLPSTKCLSTAAGFMMVFLGSSFVTVAADHKCLSLITIFPFDKNFSFSFDYAEFLELSEWRFNDLDTNQDAYLSLEEFPSGIVHVAFEISGEETILDWEKFSVGLPSFFNFIDSNGDEKLSIPEYQTLCKDGWAF